MLFMYLFICFSKGQCEVSKKSNIRRQMMLSGVLRSSDLKSGSALAAFRLLTLKSLRGYIEIASSNKISRLRAYNVNNIFLQIERINLLEVSISDRNCQFYLIYISPVYQLKSIVTRVKKFGFLEVPQNFSSKGVPNNFRG